MERAVYRWEREGPIDGIEFDPFKSPYRPATRGEADRAAPPAVAVEHDQSGEEDPVTACEEAPSDFKSRVSRFEHQLLSPIGSAFPRERVGPYVEISLAARSLKNKTPLPQTPKLSFLYRLHVHIIPFLDS